MLHGLKHLLVRVSDAHSDFNVFYLHVCKPF
ncbi:MAG: hypothetical protein ACI9T9_003095 [Oleiphilaceae bacterium]